MAHPGFRAVVGCKDRSRRLHPDPRAFEAPMVKKRTSEDADCAFHTLPSRCQKNCFDQSRRWLIFAETKSAEDKVTYRMISAFGQLGSGHELPTRGVSKTWISVKQSSI